MIEKECNSNISEWIDEWTFKGINTDLHTHKIHKYPAMFIPQLVRKIILEYSNEGDTILDIFNGSGSTLVECILTNRNGIGIELNPLANLISKVKTTPLDLSEVRKNIVVSNNYFLTIPNQLNLLNLKILDFGFTKLRLLIFQN